MRGLRAEILSALAAAGVRYLVVGGVAVVLHGHLRTTLDLDLVVELSPDNARRAMETLVALGFNPVVPVAAVSFADPDERRRWMSEKNMVVFSLWTDRDPAFKVDLFVEEPFDFRAAWERAVPIDLGHATVRVASIPDLVAMKRLAGRPQDLADIEALSALG